MASSTALASPSCMPLLKIIGEACRHGVYNDMVAKKLRWATATDTLLYPHAGSELDGRGRGGGKASAHSHAY